MLRSVINDYAAKVGITLKQKYDAENVSDGMSLVVSTGAVTLLPLYVTKYADPLGCRSPVAGRASDYRSGDGLQQIEYLSVSEAITLSRSDELVAAVSQKDASHSKLELDSCRGSISHWPDSLSCDVHSKRSGPTGIKLGTAVDSRSEVQRVYENRICTSLPSSLRIAWNGVLKPRHFLGVRLAVRMMSWISSSDTLSMSI